MSFRGECYVMLREGRRDLLLVNQLSATTLQLQKIRADFGVPFAQLSPIEIVNLAPSSFIF